MSGRLVDQLGLVAALYLYFNSLITVDRKVEQKSGIPVGSGSVGVAVAGVWVQSMSVVLGRCRSYPPFGAC